MVRIKIQYDRYNRTFTLVDKEFGPLLVDGEVYELIAPVMVEEDDAEEQPIDISLLAHA